MTPLPPSQRTPLRSQSLTQSSTSPRRRSGVRKTHSDLYRKVALTRSASRVLSQHSVSLKKATLSRPMTKPFLLRLLKETTKKNDMHVRVYKTSLMTR